MILNLLEELLYHFFSYLFRARSKYLHNLNGYARHLIQKSTVYRKPCFLQQSNNTGL